MATLLRLPLALPHFLWAFLWQWVFLVALLWAYVVAIVFGGLEDDLHAFLARYVRYTTHVAAYLLLVADPYPPFRGLPGSYPLDVRIAAAERQGRLGVSLRPLLALPAVVFAGVLLAVLATTGIAAWFVALVLGRVPTGLRDLAAYCLRYNAQTSAYLSLVTPRYPSLAGAPAAEEPVTPPRTP